jgi:mannose-6-phosphate isomerase-like protein (cupin superfamily)
VATPLRGELTAAKRIRMARLLALILLTIAIVAIAIVLIRPDPGLQLVTVLPPGDDRIREGTRITHLGIEIGYVEHLKIDKRPVVADLRITRSDAALRRGDHLRVHGTGLFGSRELEVIQGTGPGAALESGDTLSFRAEPPPTGRLHASSHAIGRSAVDRLGADEIADALGGVAPAAPGVVFPGSMDDHAQYVYNRRTSPSDIEQHDEWDDILIVQSGRGVIRHGGTWRNSTAIYKGERRGGSLVEPTDLDIARGDVVRIPAGEPHRIVPAGGAPLAYLVVKVRVNRSR